MFWIYLFNVMIPTMVGIGPKGGKSILARISIVNYYGDVIYDKFVLPLNDPKCGKITDFRKEITGINKYDLIKYGIPFQQCQSEIIQLLKGRKLIGHALNNDFSVLKCANTLKKNYYSTLITKQTVTPNKSGDGNKNDVDSFLNDEDSKDGNEIILPSKPTMSKRRMKKLLQRNYHAYLMTQI